MGLCHFFACGFVGVALFFTPIIWASSLEERKVDLLWDETQYAARYELEVYTESTPEPLKTYKFKTNSFSLSLPVGKYQIRARAFDKRNVSGEWSGLTEIEVPPARPELLKSLPKKVVASSQALSASILIEWKKASGAESYVLEIYNSKDEILETKSITEQSYMANLSPGEYKFKLWSVGGKEALISERLELSGIQVIGATLPSVVFLEEDFLKNNTLHWRPSSSNVEYIASIERADLDTQIWYVVEEIEGLMESQLDLGADLLPGKYRVRVASRANGWSQSEFVEKEFLIKPSLRSISSIINETD